MLFHATFAAVFQQLDLAAIPLFTGLLLAAALVHRGHATAGPVARALRPVRGTGAVAAVHRNRRGLRRRQPAQAVALLRLWREPGTHAPGHP